MAKECPPPPLPSQPHALGFGDTRNGVNGKEKVISHCLSLNFSSLDEEAVFLRPEGSYIKQTDTIFFTPPVDIKDCCSESALDCFRSQINNITSNNKRLQNKLHKNLRKSENIVKSKCEAARKAECMSCNLYEKTDSHKFLNNLLLLLQKSFITK
ncbi:interleukin-21 [Astyanax mexicanus]|uniref:interleukin-21 n=1 Tax=Astyanax mexicanus TaxID=7994 RepID=UPI0020CAC87E|nr:interleukin-21 [Astyanax mexicanus]